MSKAAVRTIVLTGGPCAGKSTAISFLQKKLADEGFKVVVVPETATELLKSGFEPGKSMDEKLEFQGHVLDRTLESEKIAKKKAEQLSGSVIVLYDRGLLDGCGYLESNAEFEPLLAKRGLSYKEELAKRYDAVFHLRSAAIGAEEFYSTHNNAARFEGLEEACRRDERLLEAWAGHPHVRIIPNEASFEQKLARLWKEVREIVR